MDAGEDAYDLRETIDRWTITDLPARQRQAVLPAIAGALGSVIHDVEGRRYLDFGFTATGAILGHNHPRYVDAVKGHLHVIGDDAFVDSDALRLHRRLGEILTPPLQKSLFVPHGEAARRVAASMAHAVTGGVGILSVNVTHDGVLSFGYPAPGASAPDGRLSMMDVSAKGANLPCPDPASCACGAGRATNGPCPWAAFEAALRLCAQRPAALLMTPFAGGAFGAGAGWARMLRRLCHHHGMLLIVDESATGYGRTGRMWAHQHDDAVPDILIVSAGFGAGISIDAICTAPDVAEQISESGCVAISPGWHAPLACRAAATAIDIVQEEDLVDRAAAIGRQLQTRLATIVAGNPMVKTVHGRGAMYAVELAPDGDRSLRALSRDVVRACRDQGLLLRDPAYDERDYHFIRVAPALVSTEAQIDEGLDILDRVLRQVANTPYAASGQGARQPGLHKLAEK